MSIEDVKKLKKQLKRGDIKRISGDLNFSRGYIHLVLNGKRECDLIIQKTVEIIKERQATRKELKEFIDCLE